MVVYEKNIFDITKAIFKNLTLLAAVHTRSSDVTLATAKKGMPVKLHTGTQRFFDEQ